MYTINVVYLVFDHKCCELYFVLTKYLYDEINQKKYASTYKIHCFNNQINIIILQYKLKYYRNTNFECVNG